MADHWNTDFSQINVLHRIQMTKHVDVLQISYCQYNHTEKIISPDDIGNRFFLNFHYWTDFQMDRHIVALSQAYT